jgi:hypothetical protein
VDKDLRERLFMAALASGLISHETAMQDVDKILEALARRYSAEGLDEVQRTPAPDENST